MAINQNYNDNNAGQPDTNWYTKAITANPEIKHFAISTADELAGLAQIVNGIGIEAYNFHNKTITLDNDIDLSGYVVEYGWIPIGDTNHKMFFGHFDGGGHIISNLTINPRRGQYRDYRGLFGYVNRGWVGNFGLTDVTIIGGNAVGSVAGCICDSIVTNIYSTGTICGYKEDIGGIVGSLLNKSSVTCSYSTCAVCGIDAFANNIGGIVGRSSPESSIVSCAALNTRVTGKTDAKIGRVIGDIYDKGDTILQSNAAYADMVTIANNSTTLLPAQNGIDITADQIRADCTIRGYFRGENGWTVEKGKLPGLSGKTVDWPGHLI